MTIDLNKINPNISKVRIIASIVSKNETDGNIPGFDNLIKACFSITDGAGKVYSCDLERETESMSRSVDVAIVQRWDKNWRFVEELIFHSGGLDNIYDDDSYVSELVSYQTPFNEIGSVFRIEETWKRTKSTTRRGRTGEIIRTTVTNVIETITDSLGLSEEEKTYRGRVLSRRPNVANKGKQLISKVEKRAKPRPKRPIISRKIEIEGVSEGKGQVSRNAVMDVRKPKGKVVKRHNDNRYNVENNSNSTNNNIEKIASSIKKHPIVKRK
jgi:hypothetical protein